MLKIHFDGEKYFARLSIDQKETVGRAGFLWDQSAKKWVTHNVRTAYRLIEHADAPTFSRIMSELSLNPTTFQGAIKVPEHRGLKPFAHQLEGVHWVLSRRSSYLAFEAGLGKTAIAPLCVNTTGGKLLVVCPSFLKLNWEYEIERWATQFLHMQLIKGQKDIVNPEADVIIVPDSVLHVHSLREQFFRLNMRFKYLFIDEAHRFKSATAKRTMSLVGNRKVKVSNETVQWKGFHHIADHCVALSGTPMPNRPLELYALVSKHAPQAVNYYDPHMFGVRYCGGFEGEWGWDYTGSSNLDELHNVLSRNYMLVKKLEDCVDLPEKLPPQLVFIERHGGDKLEREEMRLLDRVRVADLINLEAARNDQFKDRVQDMLEQNPELGGFGFISELRKMLGLSKVKASVQVIKDMLEDTDKLVVFTWHKDVATELCVELQDYAPQKIVGDTPNQRRHEIVNMFQTDKKTRVLVANIQAAGVGLTLTKSSKVVFVEPSWVPSDNDQAISRVHRIGQERPVQAFFLVVKNSLDHLILNAHQNKSVVINSAIKPTTTKGK